MKTILIFLLLPLYTITGQNACYENREGEYWPFHTDTVSYDAPKDGFSYVYSSDSLKIKDKFYRTRTKIYKSGKTNEAYLRKENKAVYYYNEKTETQSLLLPAEIKKGKKWNSTCGTYRYKIKSLDATLNTPYCDFEELLEIEILNQDNNTKYQFYYKKGVGVVGNNINDNPFSFIEPEVEVENKNFIAYGCETIENPDTQKKCTTSKVIKYLQENLSNPTPEVHGKVVYTVIIDKKGMVDDVTVKTVEGASRKQEKIGIKVLKSLPKFIPAYTGSKPVRVLYTIPIAF